ncbi:MAG: sulfotransferase domain-containing protein [Chloroflexota bacterium]
MLSADLTLDIIIKEVRKRTYQRFILDQTQPKQPLFIFGCQRSGTTMLAKIFKQDLNTTMYGERGLGIDGGLRTKPFDEIRSIFERERGTLLVAKPLVESQYAHQFLDYFSEEESLKEKGINGAKGVWLYRNYRDVANSSLNKFGTESSIKNLGPIANPDLPLDWASENVSDKTKEIVQKYFTAGMPTFDAKTLFWYVRNILFYEQKLDHHPHVLLMKYKDLVTDPKAKMRQIYAFLERAYPGDQLVKDVHSKSVNLGERIEPNSDIEALCENLWARMDETYQKQTR